MTLAQTLLLHGLYNLETGCIAHHHPSVGPWRLFNSFQASVFIARQSDARRLFLDAMPLWHRHSRFILCIICSGLRISRFCGTLAPVTESGIRNQDLDSPADPPPNFIRPE